jgi:hypothetical protein
MAKNVFLKDKAVDLRRAFEGEATMTTETPPDWVLLEAAKLSGRSHCFIETVRDRWHLDKTFRALCDMIAKHEKPPVDRKVLCAREAWDQWLNTDHDAEEWIGLRAIQLYEEGFGK